VNGRTKIAVDLSEVEQEIDQVQTKTESISNALVLTDGRVQSLSNALVATDGRVQALSNSLVLTDGRVESLSNTLATKYITLADLNDQLRENYIQQGEKVDFQVEQLTTNRINQYGLGPLVVSATMQPPPPLPALGPVNDLGEAASP
jgi:chromosome segregation ATPase